MGTWTVGRIMRYCKKKGWRCELEAVPRLKKFKRVKCGDDDNGLSNNV